MPWHIENDRPDCAGYAVVKDADGELEGCHRTRTQAEAQLTALNIAEYGDDEERAGTGPAAIITDIDGTLIDTERGPNRELLAMLDETDAAILVVTGRLEDRRDATVQLLDDLDIDYALLEMSPGGDPNAHKRDTAARLLENFTIAEAWDDNPDARAAYQELGITARTPWQRSNLDVAREILASLRTSH